MFQASGDRQRVSRLSASRNHVSYHWSSEKHVTCPSGLKKQLSLPSVSEKHGEPTSAGKKHLASFRQCQAQDNVSNFDFALVRRAIFISMLRSLLSESLSRTLWPFLISDRMGKGKMAPLDSNPEDHGHLLGDGIGRMPRGCGKNRGCQKFQSRSCAGAFRAFIITHSRLRASGKTGNALLHVGKPCARTFAPSIFPEHALSSAAPLVRAFNVLVPLGKCVSSDDSVSRLCLVLFWLRCLRCTGNGKCGQGVDLVDNSGSNCEHVCPGMQLAQSVEFSDDYGSLCLVEEDKRHHKVEDASSGQV